MGKGKAMNYVETSDLKQYTLDQIAKDKHSCKTY